MGSSYPVEPNQRTQGMTSHYLKGNLYNVVLDPTKGPLSAHRIGCGVNVVLHSSLQEMNLGPGKGNNEGIPWDFTQDYLTP